MKTSRSGLISLAARMIARVRSLRKRPIGAEAPSALLRADVVAEPEHVDAESGQPPRLRDAQIGDALADRVADLRIGQEIHQEPLHAAHQPRPLEDRLIQLAGDRVAASMVLGNSLREPLVAIVGRNVGPGERPFAPRPCGRFERMELVLDEMLDRSGYAAATPFVEGRVRRNGSAKCRENRSFFAWDSDRRFECRSRSSRQGDGRNPSPSDRPPSMTA